MPLRPMRLAIISDIHANLPALDAVLTDVEAADTESVWCLGDLVGYGAEPDACVKLTVESCELSLLGNHDLAVLERIDASTFSPAAAEAVRWTQGVATPATISSLGALEPLDESREVGLYHASPRDPIWEYVLWPEQAGECLAKQPLRVSLIGHSHVALHFNGDGDDLANSTRGAHAPEGTVLDLAEGRWLLNPGSVGQPRDGDPRAAWLELDTEAWSATYRRVAYDIDSAAQAITDAGLPKHLARRLFTGQ